MARFSRITKKLVAVTVATDDLNDALYNFQNAIGIDSGDVAGVVFSGGLGDEWGIAPTGRRQEMIEHYIATERAMAGQ